MTDPFANYVPPAKNASIRTATVGDWYQGKVVAIGQPFDKRNDEKQVIGKTYTLTLELLQVHVKALPAVPAHGIKAYEPPEVGETVVRFVDVGRADERELLAAVKKAGRSSLEVGDIVAEKLLEEIDVNKPKPFKKRGFVVELGKPVDPFGEDTPF